MFKQQWQTSPVSIIQAKMKSLEEFFSTHPVESHPLPKIVLLDALAEILNEMEQGIGAANMSELSRLNNTDAREVILELSELEVEDLSASGFQKQVNSLTSLVQTCKSKEGL